jgi:hypothetical protein
VGTTVVLNAKPTTWALSLTAKHASAKRIQVSSTLTMPSIPGSFNGKTTDSESVD